jgi:hypothetical protein
VRQNAKGDGELSIDDEEREAIKGDPLSKVIFLEDDELVKLANVFLQIPFEYGGMGGIVGKKYEAIKDFLRWNDFDVKNWTPIVLQMGNIWANESSKNK